MAGSQDYGYLGPDYTVIDDIKLPGQVGVYREPTVNAILSSVGGMNYYLDTIAFGSATGLDKGSPFPLGIRYFIDTGLTCSNGASMYEYVDGITKGDILGKKIADGLASSNLPGLKGLAPGMLENARDALDPRPFFSAITGSGYPVCQQVQCPVGNVYGKIQEPDKPTPFIKGNIVYVDGRPVQNKWVQSYLDDNSEYTIDKQTYDETSKCYEPDGTLKPIPGCSIKTTPKRIPRGPKYSNCTLVSPTTDAEYFSNYEQYNPLISLGTLAIIGITVTLLLSR